MFCCCVCVVYCTCPANENNNTRAQQNFFAGASQTNVRRYLQELQWHRVQNLCQSRWQTHRGASRRRMPSSIRNTKPFEPTTPATASKRTHDTWAKAKKLQQQQMQCMDYWRGAASGDNTARQVARSIQRTQANTTPNHSAPKKVNVCVFIAATGFVHVRLACNKAITLWCCKRAYASGSQRRECGAFICC